MTEEERELLILLAEMIHQIYVIETAKIFADNKEKSELHLAPVRDRMAALITMLRHGAGGR